MKVIFQINDRELATDIIMAILLPFSPWETLL